ncbi:MAG TPA: tetratricopeptide repeat protein [Terriglobales bacterium]
MSIETEASQVTKNSVTEENKSWFAWLPALLGLLVYLPTLRDGFVWDDRFAIVGNTGMRSWASLPDALLGPIDPSVSMYRPVVSLVQVIEYHLFGLHAWGYHLTSAVLHAVACALVFRVALVLGKDRNFALLAGCLFAVHAVHLEAVAWASTVADPLVACIIVAGFLSYLKYRHERSAPRLVAVCAWVFLGLMTKETALVLPLLFAAYEVICVEKAARSLRVHIVPAIAVILTVGIYAFLRSRAYVGFVANENEGTLNFATMVFTWPSLLVRYLRLMLWPYPLSPFYDSDYVKSADAQFWLGIGVLVLLAVAIYLVSRKIEGGALVRFTAIAMLLSIVPVLDLRVFQFREFFHDRFVYVPSIFFALLVAWLLLHAVRALGASASAYAAVGAVLLLANAGALLAQEPYWVNDFALWRHAAEVAPHNPRPAFSLVDEYLQRGEIVGAELQLEHVISIVPAPKALFMLGQVRLMQGKAAAAEGPLRKAITIAPDRPAQHFVLGQCLEQLGRRDEAVAAYRAETAINSQFKQAALERLAQLGARQ